MRIPHFHLLTPFLFLLNLVYCYSLPFEGQWYDPFGNHFELTYSQTGVGFFKPFKSDEKSAIFEMLSPNSEGTYFNIKSLTKPPEMGTLNQVNPFCFFTRIGPGEARFYYKNPRNKLQNRTYLWSSMDLQTDYLLLLFQELDKTVQGNLHFWVKKSWGVLIKGFLIEDYAGKDLDFILEGENLLIPPPDFPSFNTFVSRQEPDKTFVDRSKKALNLLFKFWILAVQLEGLAQSGFQSKIQPVRDLLILEKMEELKKILLDRPFDPVFFKQNFLPLFLDSMTLKLDKVHKGGGFLWRKRFSKFFNSSLSPFLKGNPRIAPEVPGFIKGFQENQKGD